MCLYNQDADTVCLKRDVDSVMRELAGKIIRKLLRDEVERILVWKRFTVGMYREQTEVEKAQAELKEVEQKAIEDLKAIMMRDLATLTPFEWPPERRRYEVERVVERAESEVVPKIEAAKRTGVYESSSRVMGGGEAMRQNQQIDKERRWKNQ